MSAPKAKSKAKPKPAASMVVAISKHLVFGDEPNIKTALTNIANFQAHLIKPVLAQHTAENTTLMFYGFKEKICSTEKSLVMKQNVAIRGAVDEWSLFHYRTQEKFDKKRNTILEKLSVKAKSFGGVLHSHFRLFTMAIYSRRLLNACLLVFDAKELLFKQSTDLKRDIASLVCQTVVLILSSVSKLGSSHTQAEKLKEAITTRKRIAQGLKKDIASSSSVDDVSVNDETVAMICGFIEDRLTIITKKNDDVIAFHELVQYLRRAVLEYGALGVYSSLSYGCMGSGDAGASLDKMPNIDLDKLDLEWVIRQKGINDLLAQYISDNFVSMSEMTSPPVFFYIRHKASYPIPSSSNGQIYPMETCDNLNLFLTSANSSFTAKYKRLGYQYSRHKKTVSFIYEITDLHESR